MGVEEHLGLRLEAVTAEWNAAFAQAKVGAASLGHTVASVTAEMNKAESATKKLGGMKWTDLTTGLNSALDLVKKFTGFVADTAALAHFGAEMKNLEARVPVERLRMMQEATEGAVDKVTLMKFSMKALSGEMHLTEDGLDTVLRAANTLGDKGFGDTAENADKLMEALRKGSSKGLREFGITLKDTADKQANVNALMKDFSKLAGESPPVDAGLKEIERVQTAWSDFVTDVKAGLGDIIMRLAEGIAKLTGLMDYSKSDKLQQKAQAAAKKAAPSVSMGESGELASFGPFGAVDNMITDMVGGDYAASRRAELLKYQVAQAEALAEAAHVMIWEDKTEQARQFVEDALRKSKDKGKKWEGKMPGGGGGAGAKGRSEWGADYIHEALLGGDRALSAGIGWGGTIYSNASNFVNPDFDLAGAGMAAAEGGALGGAADPRWAKFQTQIEDRTSLLGGSFGAFSDGLAASVDAAITGSESIGKAFMKASAMALKALAIESTVRAAYNTAMGIGAAIFNPAAAAGYFASAAEFALSAALAGAGAATLGSAGGGFGASGGTSPRTPAGGGYGSNPSNGAQGGQQINLYIGDGFVGRPDELAVAIADTLNHGVQSGRVRSVVTTKPGAVTFRN